MCEECGLKRRTIWVIADRKNVQRCAVCAKLHGAVIAKEFQEHHGNDNGQLALKFSGCVAKALALRLLTVTDLECLEVATLE